MQELIKMQKNYKILEVLPKQGLEPRQFLRHCFDIAELTPRELLEEETDSQYRKNVSLYYVQS